VKKTLLCILFIFVLCFSMVGCQSQTGGTGSKEVLNVYNWGEYIDPEVLDLFEKEYDIKINYEIYPTNEDMYVKVSAQTSPYDILVPSDYMIERLIQQDMLQKIDVSKLTNYQYIDERFKNLSYDPNNEYSVPYFWGTLGILYNTEMVSGPVESWDILWDPAYEGKILMLDSVRDTMAVALSKLGYSVNTVDPDELEQAKQLLIEQRPLVLAYVVDEIRDMMIGGEAALAILWSGDSMDAMSSEPSLNYVVPNEGSNKWFDAMVIPKNSQNPDAAHLFIDFMTRPEISLMNTDYVGYSTVNAETLKLLDEETAQSEVYAPSVAVLERCEIFNDLDQAGLTLYGDIWTEILAH